MSIRLSPAVESLVKALGKLPATAPGRPSAPPSICFRTGMSPSTNSAAAVERVRRGVGRCRLCNTFTEGGYLPRVP